MKFRRAFQWTLRLSALLAVGAAPLVQSGVAQAKTKRRCRAEPGTSTRAVRGMQCANGKKLVAKLFDETAANTTPFGKKRTYEVTGWAGTLVQTERTFRCSVLYTRGSGANRGGIDLNVTCHDFNGDATYYTEEQDNE